MKKSKTILLISIFFVLSTQGLKAIWFSNDPPAFTKSIGVGNDVRGASLFLQSLSSFYLLLNESELSNGGIILPDNKKAKIVLDDLVNKLISSQDYLNALYIETSTTAIDSTSLSRLMAFDYDLFAKERKYNPYIMSKIKMYLSKGDVPGYIGTLLKSLDQNLSILKQLSGNLNSGISIPLERLQTLYDIMNDTMLSGYYASLIFALIK